MGFADFSYYFFNCYFYFVDYGHKNQKGLFFYAKQCIKLMERLFFVKWHKLTLGNIIVYK